MVYLFPIIPLNSALSNGLFPSGDTSRAFCPIFGRTLELRSLVLVASFGTLSLTIAIYKPEFAQDYLPCMDSATR